MSEQKDGNLIGRALALALILGAAYGVTSISNGRMCPLGNGRCCEMSSAQAKPADAKAAPVEKDAPAEDKAE